MLFSDNQTKHFYVLDGVTATTNYLVTPSGSADLKRFIAVHSDGNETSDVINKKLVKKAVVNEMKPTYFRNWTITAPTSVAAGTTYYLYFYLENMLGFGMQDRWDRVASYTATGTDAATVMQNLALDLWGKLNAAGPIKNDFDVYYGGTLVTKSDFETHTLPTAASGTNIVVKETLAGSGTDVDDLALRMHTNPYAYNVTMSTGKSVDGTIEPWTSSQKEIKGVDDTNRVYISAAKKVLAMELYFLRNRGDLYDLNKDFYTSILNKTHTKLVNQSIDSTGDTPVIVETPQAYYIIDIDYAYSDTLGFTYHSDKQLSIAVPTSTKSDATAIMNAILDIS